MTTKMLKTAAASAALLIAASLGGQAFAQNYGGHGSGGQPQPAYDQRGDYGQGDHGRGDYGAQSNYDRDFGARGFNDRDFDQRGGRFYYSGDVRQRMERIEQWARFGARSGRLNRWEARRAFGMLDQVRQQARWSNRDGFMSPREQMALNGRLDEVIRFIRVHQRRIDDGRRY
jgi:hypothetical protein